MKSNVGINELLKNMPTEQGIAMHSGAAHPTALATHLAQAAPELVGRRVYTLMPSGALPYAQPPARDYLELATFLPGAGLRPAMNAGRVHAIREALSNIPTLIQQRVLNIGAVFLRVSPPDTSGRVCLGVSTDYMLAAIESAQVIIAEIDPTVPQLCGNCWLDAKRITTCIDSVDAVHVLPVGEPDCAEQIIATHIASLIPDGATLQLGVGNLPDQVLIRLSHLKDLGLHTGIIGSSAVPLIENGVINNARKSVFPGISLATMALGTEDLYRFLHRNPLFEMHPCSTTHDPTLLARLTTLHAVNTALQVDLSGAVNAEWSGDRRVALPGGLTDFAHAAAKMKQGASIMAVRALDRAGRSNIVPSLRSDTPPSLLGNAVDFYVSEFGIAAVRGMSLAERRAALIRIAHPQHRDLLEKG